MPDSSGHNIGGKVLVYNMMRAKKTSEAYLKFEDKEVVLPVISGTEGEKAVDISSLRKSTGLITMDPALPGYPH